MPELPEVERARKLIAESLTGYKIVNVDAQEDKIVYTGGTNHRDFADELIGRTIEGCERKGKNFWLNLSGEGRLPVLHFGMTGMIQLKGSEPTWYRRRPKESSSDWPPRFYKFTLECEPQPGAVSDEPRALAFMDGRRLGRIRLLPDPVLDHKPLSVLGFDPVLSHPTIDEFRKLIEKKKGTVKGTIMDQAFSAGVGNWVADEVLYQARIHPACPINALSEQNIVDLHHQLNAVPAKAVEVNADSRQFPDDWLFRWRWSKGKKQTKGKKKNDEAGEEEGDGGDLKPKGLEFLPLPDGKPATIDFIEVGGRTTAVVTELQKMPQGVDIKPKISKGGKGSQKRKAKDSDSDTPSGTSETSDAEEKPKITTPRQKAAAERRVKAEDVKPDISSPVRKARKSDTKSTTPSKKPSGRQRGAKSRVKVKTEPDSDGSSDLSDVP